MSRFWWLCPWAAWVGAPLGQLLSWDFLPPLFCDGFFFPDSVSYSWVIPSSQWILFSCSFLKMDVQEVKLLLSCRAEDVSLFFLMSYFILEYNWFSVQQVKWSEVKLLSRVQLFVTLWTVAHQAPLSMEFTGKNTRVGCHSLLQGIFLMQRWNLGLLHCRQILYHRNHQGSPLCRTIAATEKIAQPESWELSFIWWYSEDLSLGGSLSE